MTEASGPLGIGLWSLCPRGAWCKFGFGPDIETTQRHLQKVATCRVTKPGLKFFLSTTAECWLAIYNRSPGRQPGPRRVASAVLLGGSQEHEDWIESTTSKVPVMVSPGGPSGHTLCLLLLATAACLWLPCQGTAYKSFLKRHLDNPKTNFGSNHEYCDQMMRRRGMKCQQKNTFIHATEEQLKSICNSRGQVMDGNTLSKALFPITTCKLRRFLRKVLCRYKGKSKIRRIRVTCEKGLPVHFISSA
ncbi:PREDICTED: angiogenin-like [Gekko japonicus]|uniref:Angiogenin-like n=1 Tax=Gekko japonicus TaxID=146911 RepID=A0ABM1KII3_GEKJA|nr:PREDICTED: angiogenin-like [Gekko japonicus]